MKILRWLSLVLWLAIALAYLAFFFIDLRLDFTQILQPCRGADCNYLAISEAEFAVLAAWGVSPLVYALTLTGASLAGGAVCWALAGMVFWRRGASPLSWAVSLALVIIPVTLIADVDNVAANLPVLFLPSAILNQVGSTVFLLFLYTFPNGRFYPRLAFVPLGLSILGFGAMSVITGYPGIGTHSRPSVEVTVAILLAIMVTAMTFQILRYRNVSTPLERQQTRWVILGLIGLMAAFPVWFFIFGGLVNAPPGVPRLLLTVGGWLACITLINALPVTLGIAILRFRLWDLDLILRRTLTYSLLSALLVATYLGSVLLLQSGFRAATGEGQNQLVTVLSTLVIAALVVPLRRRVQAFIDRRFFRRKYDAARALAAFAARARDETDLNQLSHQLVDIVEETMQPASTSLWLKDNRPA